MKTVSPVRRSGRRCRTRRGCSATDRPSGRSRRRSGEIRRGTGRCRGRAWRRGRRRRPRHGRRASSAASPRTGRTARSPSPAASRLARVDDVVDVAVGGEAHVVELDLVEAGARGDLGDGDVVVPDPPVVRVRPAEAGVVTPDRAVAALDREVRARRRQQRILEDDDAADQVEALRVRASGDLRAACSTAARRRPCSPAAPPTARSRSRRSRP